MAITDAVAGQRIKVVVLIDSILNAGGGESLAVEAAIGLDPERFDRVLCISRWSDRAHEVERARDLLARLDTAGVRVVGLRRSSRWRVWEWWPLIRLLRRDRVDVIHGHLFGSNIWATVVGRLAGVPVVIAHEHMWSYSGGALRPLIDRELIARFADSFVAVSSEGRRAMIEVEGIDPSAIVLIPNGMPELGPGNGVRVRTELGIPDGAPVIGSTGHLRPEKAFEVLLDAAAIVARDHPDLRVLIAGEGPERACLERRIGELGLEGRALLLGARADVPDLLAAMQVGVCCSDFEGGPLSVMEYMDAGLPVAATAVGGLPELVGDGVSGILVPPRDASALAAAIERLLDDPERAREMGERGRERRRRDHGIEAWVGRLEQLYVALLAQRP